jgi:hypothetical protein
MRIKTHQPQSITVRTIPKALDDAEVVDRRKELKLAREVSATTIAGRKLRASGLKKLRAGTGFTNNTSK